MRSRSALAAAAGSVVVAAAALGAGALPGPALAQDSEFWVNPDTQAAQWVAANPDDPRASLIDERIARVPQGTWLTQHNPESVQAEVDAVVGAAESAGQIPILVVYNVPNRDCAGASSGGAPNHTEYRAWVDQVAAGLAGRPAYIVLEPDVLPLMSTCMDDAEQAEVQESMSHAGAALKAGSDQARVYFDIGHSQWLAVDDAAGRLLAADVTANADGISTNTSNYNFTEDEIGFATAVLDAIGDPNLGAVIDTSRNGNGPLGAEWCDPEGRAIGQEPTSATGNDRIDALLWVKLPGEADGCAGPAGEFIPDLAFELANNAPDPDPGPTPSESPDPEPTPTESSDPDPEADCDVAVSVDSWNNGLVANYTVTNGGASWSEWTMTFTAADGVSLTNGWNGVWTQQGNQLTVSNEGWNGTVTTAGTVSVGHQATHTGDVSFTDFAVNGVACS